MRVPATVANLGPGFDMLAMALQLQNEVRAESTDGPSVTIEVDGEPEASGAAELLDPATNLVARAYLEVCSRLAVPVGARGVRLGCVNAIPMGRGLGSSAAATLAGVLVAVALHRVPWDERAILECVAGFEGHVDNAAAALLGGLAICAPGAAPQRCDLPDEIHAIVFVPQTCLATHEARQVVAASFSRDDAIYNASRCALLVRALLTRDYGALREAMDDRWHQAQRAALFPPMTSLIAAAYEGGADGACVAGSGPSILALCAREPAPVSAAMAEAARRLSVPGVVMVLRPRNFGSRVDVRE